MPQMKPSMWLMILLLAALHMFSMKMTECYRQSKEMEKMKKKENYKENNKANKKSEMNKKTNTENKENETMENQKPKMKK